MFQIAMKGILIMSNESIQFIEMARNHSINQAIKRAVIFDDYINSPNHYYCPICACETGRLISKYGDWETWECVCGYQDAFKIK